MKIRCFVLEERLNPLKRIRMCMRHIENESPSTLAAAAVTVCHCFSVWPATASEEATARRARSIGGGGRRRPSVRNGLCALRTLAAKGFTTARRGTARRASSTPSLPPSLTNSNPFLIPFGGLRAAAMGRRWCSLTHHAATSSRDHVRDISGRLGGHAGESD